MKRKALLRSRLPFLLLTALWASPALRAGAQTPVHPASPGSSASPYTTTVEVRWDDMSLTARVALDLRKAGIRMPAGRTEAERMIERDLPSLIQDTVFLIPVDSYRTVGDTLQDGTLSINDLLSLLKSLTRRESSFTPDFRTFSAVYELSLTDIASLYVRHSSPYELPAPLDYVPSRPYSGIVIYAKGSLPVYGEHVEAAAVPCLFPRIYDERMNKILERNLVSPEAIRRWGLVGYSNDLVAASLGGKDGRQSPAHSRLRGIRHRAHRPRDLPGGGPAHPLPAGKPCPPARRPGGHRHRRQGSLTPGGVPDGEPPPRGPLVFLACLRSGG